MLDFPRWKVWSIVLVLLAGVVLALPSLMPERTATQLGLARMPRINLGLDLSGGSHLLLEADTADLAKQNLQKMEDSIRTEMRRNDPPIGIGDIATDGGKLSFMVRDVTQLDAAVERARAQTQAVGVTGQRDWNVAVVDGTRIVMSPSQAGLNDAVDKGMATATEVVRKRIDSLGTKEPTIVREGSTRILVQVPGYQDPAGLKALIGKTAKLEFKMVDMTADPALTAQGKANPGDQILPYPNGPGGQRLIAVNRRAIISGDELTNAQVGHDENQQPTVEITFDGQGGKKFARVTQENSGKQFAMILDNSVLSAPSINERIREERRRGRGVIQSIELGYKEASRTIFEANTVHAISGLIMLALGSGPVKGFAVVLLIGIATSVFTAVLFTRMMVALYIRKVRPTELHI